MKKLLFFLTTMFIMNVVHSQEQAHLVRIKDGDTFIAEWKHKQYTCRLENVDAPELSQKYGPEASAYLYQMLKGHWFYVEAHKTDLYGRTLVTVSIDGKRLDSMLIKNGIVWHYINYSSDNMLSQCMQDAIKSQKGLWQCGKDAVCPPWLYRHYTYRNKLKYCKGCNS